jgi:hypothetical protein
MLRKVVLVACMFGFIAGALLFAHGSSQADPPKQKDNQSARVF